MSSTAVDEPMADVALALNSPRSSLAWRTIVSFWKFFVGVLFCSGPLASVFVVGWTMRLMQRCALKQWFNRSEQARHEPFAEFVASNERMRHSVHWPNWLLQKNARDTLRGAWATFGLGRRARLLLGALFGSFGQNAKLGVQGILNTWVITMPGCMLWWFAWYDGWNNSFHKGYEQFFVGPATGWLGIGLFMLVMTCLPMAQARQAATGDWRTFCDFRFVRRLIRCQWLACAGLAALYGVVSLPVIILKTIPLGFSEMLSNYEQMTDADVVQFLRRYFFWLCVFVFPAYVLVRLVATRIYATGLLVALRRGKIQKENLCHMEAFMLGRMNMLHAPASQAPHPLVRVSLGVSGGVARVCVGAVSLFLWFVFVAQIFVSQFLNYHPIVGWMNQPLVQLPWFRYLP